jgi:hypothetical protein
MEVEMSTPCRSEDNVKADFGDNSSEDANWTQPAQDITNTALKISVTVELVPRLKI